MKVPISPAPLERVEGRELAWSLSFAVRSYFWLSSLNCSLFSAQFSKSAT